MKKLSFTQYARAKQFLNTDARRLERAMFHYEFESGDATDVFTELKKFQNQDGGFGHGLEPDLRCKESSALATTVALQYLSNVQSNQKNEMIDDCFRFFANTYKNEGNGWEIIPPEADHAPRAIWWNYSGIAPNWGNPNAEILSYLYTYPQFLTKELSDLQQHLTHYAINYLHNDCDISEMHEMFCFIRLFKVIPADLRSRSIDRLEQFIDNCVVKNPEERNGYCAVPLQIVDSPESRYYEKYADVIPYDLDRLIESQAEDGSWESNWTWGRYEEDWQQAKREWKGCITLRNLRTLKLFNRIE